MKKTCSNVMVDSAAVILLQNKFRHVFIASQRQLEMIAGRIIKHKDSQTFGSDGRACMEHIKTLVHFERLPSALDGSTGELACAS